MNIRKIHWIDVGRIALTFATIVPVGARAADWSWTSTTVPEPEKAGYGRCDWADAANWGDGASGCPDLSSEAALADTYTFASAISRWQWIVLPQLSQQPSGYLGSLNGGFHNSIVLTSEARQPNRLFAVANPNGFMGDWFIEGASDGTGVSSGFLLPATESFTPVLQRVRLAGGMQFKVATGGTAELGYPFGEGAFSVNKTVKNMESTAGTLAIKRSPGPRSELRVYGGKVVLTGRAYADDAELVAGAALHLDASRTDTLTVDDDGVSRWNDADGGSNFAVPVSNSGKPGVIENRVNNRAVVNFGAQKYSSTGVYGDPEALGSPSRLVLDSTVEDVKELFVVFEDASEECVGPSLFNNDTYSRATEKGRLFANQGMADDRTRFAAVETADISLDGQAVEHSLTTYGFVGRLHVVSVGHRGDYSGLLSAIGAPSTGGNRWGGTHIAEIVAYAKSLTPGQRRQNVAYLRRKWQAEADAKDLDYGAVVVEADATLEVADGTTVEIGQLKAADGVSRIIKTGGGTLFIGAYLSPEVEVEVRGGSVKFGSPIAKAAPAKADNPLVWLDANTLSEASVTEWADARGGSLIAANRDGDTYPAATLDTTTVPGKKMVDMGATVSKDSPSTYFLIKDNGVELGNAVRCGFMVYYKNAASAVVPSSSGNALRVIDGTSKFIDAGWGNAYAVGGLWALDGLPIDPTNCREADGNTAGEVHVISFRFSSMMPVNMLGGDRSGSNNVHGGIKFGEVLLYDRVLTDGEWKDTEDYLLRKWKGTGHPVDETAAAPLKLAYAGEADNVIDVDSDRELASLVLNGSKPVVKRGTGSVILPNAVESAIVSYAAEGGSLQCKVESAIRATTLLSRAYYHADAMDEKSLDTTTVGDVVRVNEWKSSSGQTVSATPHATPQDEDRPFVNEITINGQVRKVVDFGSFATVKSSALPADGTSYGMTIGSGAASLAELHYVVCDSDSSDGEASGYRTPVIGNVGQRLDLKDNTNPIWRGTSQGVLAVKNHASAFAYGETWLNGLSVPAISTIPDFRQFYQVTMVPTGALSVAWTLARRSSNEIGGLQIGEVVMYSETNSAAERAMVDAYLAKKWFGTGEGYPWQVADLTVKDGATLSLAPAPGHTTVAAKLSGDGTVSVGAVTAEEVVPGGVGKVGTLFVTDDLVLTDGATLRIDLARTEADKLVVDGKLTLSGYGSVVAEQCAAGRRPAGDYVLAEATGGITCADISAWTFASESGIEGRLRIVDGDKLVLSIPPQGLMLIFR